MCVRVFSHKAEKLTDGTRRQTKSAIADAYFQRNNKGQILANPDAPKFRDIVKNVDCKFEKDSVTGVKTD